MIGIVNYGMGNIASVKNALDYLRINSVIIDNPNKLYNMDKLLLPGVGAFGMAMHNLNYSGFSDTIKELVIIKKKPILGICLGMQLLLESSTEHGFHLGLDLIKGKVLFLGNVINNLSIPHIGWNEVNYCKTSVLFRNLKVESTFYFVHSFYCEIESLKNVSGTTDYGFTFHSSLEDEHVFGCQFHPEKSQHNGLLVLSNFNNY